MFRVEYNSLLEVDDRNDSICKPCRYTHTHKSEDKECIIGIQLVSGLNSNYSSCSDGQNRQTKENPEAGLATILSADWTINL